MMSAMSEACSKALNALKVLLTDPNSYGPWCIGTSEMFWKKIETEGLTPVVCSASGVCADSTYEDVAGRNLNRVWIGRAGHKMCSTYARRAVKKSTGKPIKITFSTNLTKNGMRPSKEFVEENGFDTGAPNLSDIPKATALLNEAKTICSPEEIKQLLISLPDWSKSLIAKKSANFASLININPIIIENVDMTEPLKNQWDD